MKKVVKKAVAKTITYTDLLIHVSGEYLTDNYPANLAKMSDEEINKFIEENIYEPFENESVEDVRSLIDNGANALAGFLVAKGIEIVK
jgi:hypothetical protein